MIHFPLHRPVFPLHIFSQTSALFLETNLASRWKGVGFPALLEGPRTSPELPGDFAGSSLTVKLNNSNPEVPWNFSPEVPRTSPEVGPFISQELSLNFGCVRARRHVCVSSKNKPPFMILNPAEHTAESCTFLPKNAFSNRTMHFPKEKCLFLQKI